jgi:hypothetical protein
MTGGKQAARDTRHGRRGGGWIEDDERWAGAARMAAARAACGVAPGPLDAEAMRRAGR